MLKRKFLHAKLAPTWRGSSRRFDEGRGLIITGDRKQFFFRSTLSSFKHTRAYTKLHTVSIFFHICLDYCLCYSPYSHEVCIWSLRDLDLGVWNRSGDQ